MSSPVEGLFCKEHIDLFIRHDEQISSAFFKLISKSRPKSFPSSISDNRPEEIAALQNISKFAISLFNIIRTKAAKGNLSFKFNSENQSKAVQYFELPSLRDEFFEKPLFAQIIQNLFARCLNITITSKESEWTLSWEIDNPFLCFKPIFEPPCNLHAAQKANWIEYFNKAPKHDVLFSVDDQLIKVHRHFLNQSKYLKKLLKYKWKNKNEPILIEDCSYCVFKAMLRFLYVGEIEELDANNYKTLFQLYCLADLIQHQHLKHYCLTLLNQLIDDKNFLFYAFYQKRFDDEYLLKLCQWFVTKEFDYGSKIEISHFSTEQLFETYVVCRRFDAKELEKACLIHLQEHLQIDIGLDEFKLVLTSLDDQDLRAWFNQQFQRLKKAVV